MAGLRKNLMPPLRKNLTGCLGIELETTSRIEIYVTTFDHGWKTTFVLIFILQIIQCIKSFKRYNCLFNFKKLS